MKLVIFLFFSIPYFSFSQFDPVFTSAGFTPFFFNPAATGSLNTFSANAVYRNQWPSIPGRFQTVGLNFETNTKFKLNASKKEFNMPLGVNAIFETTYWLNKQTVNVPISFPIKLTNSTIAIGASIGIKHVAFNNTFSSFGTTPFSEENTSLDLNTGMFWYGKNHYLGVFMSNLNPPDINFYTTYTNYYLQAGYKFKLGQHYVFPMLDAFYSNGYSSYRTMVYFQFKEDVFSLLVGYQQKDSYLLGGTVRIKHVKLAYVYDITKSVLDNASGGSHEIRLSYTIKKQ